MAADELLTVAQAARALGVNRWRVHQLIRAGRLPAERLGSVLVVRRTDVLAYQPRPPGRPAKPR